MPYNLLELTIRTNKGLVLWLFEESQLGLRGTWSQLTLPGWSHGHISETLVVAHQVFRERKNMFAELFLVVIERCEINLLKLVSAWEILTAFIFSCL